MKVCGRCKLRPKRKHHNSKWCAICSQELRHRPAHNLSRTEQSEVRRLAGKMSRDDIAKEVGRSLSSIRRYCRQAGISLMFDRDYPEEVRREVCEYYSVYGKVKTRKRFPSVTVRSIVERYLKKYELNPRQIRWTKEQIVEAAKMAGIISHASQARYFNRPRAFEGSIRSLWVKKFGNSGGHVPGLKAQLAYQLVEGGRRIYRKDRTGSALFLPIKPLEVSFWMPRKGRRVRYLPRRIFLWVDIAENLRPDLHPEIKQIVRTMAKFQKWLHGTKNVRAAIKDLIKHREIIKKGDENGKHDHK